MTQVTAAAIDVPAQLDGEPPRSRVGWVDRAKGIGILAIVFGHVWRGVHNAGLGISESKYHAVDDWLYAWHVPLFFVLAGLFAPRSADKGAGVFVLDKVRTILWPYVVWSVLQGYARRFLIKGGPPEEGGPFTLARLVTDPYGQFWFFMCLFVCLMLFLAMYKARLGRVGILVIAIAFYATAARRVPLGPWGTAYVVRNYLLYVAIGAAAAPLIARLVVNAPVWGLLLFSAVLFAVLTVLSWQGLGNIQFTNPAGALVGTFAVIALAGVTDRCGLRWLEYFGRVSLPIYVAHVLALSATRAALTKGLHVSSVPVHLLAGTAVGVIVPVLLAWAGARVRTLNWLFALPAPARAM